MQPTHLPFRPGYRALRRGRVSTPGQAYLITTVVKDREPVFAAFEAGALASRIVSQDLAGGHFIIWVLMPDHFHGVLLLGEGATLPQCVQRYKGTIARGINQLLGRSGPLWQDGFHDHALRKEEDLEQISRYVVANPVRAGLVGRVGDYPFWNTAWI